MAEGFRVRSYGGDLGGTVGNSQAEGELQSWGGKTWEAHQTPLGPSLISVQIHLLT